MWTPVLKIAILIHNAPASAVVNNYRKEHIEIISRITSETHTTAQQDEVTTTISSGLKLRGYTDSDYYNVGNIHNFLVGRGITSERLNYYEGRNFSKVETYHGVPYAEANRFEKPQFWSNPESFEELSCLEHGPVCPQGSAYPESEDCLILDIYKPIECGVSNPCDIFVYIHGGYYYVGSNRDSQGTFLAASQGKIIVQVQYRLGILGFFSTGTDDAIGNYGLWDQRLAIEWVKREAANFGGNPDTIEIAGESAGGGSCNAQIFYDAMSVERGGEQLFKVSHQMSGNAMAAWSITYPHQLQHYLEITHQFLAVNDTDYSEAELDRSALTAYFRNISVEKIVELTNMVSIDIIHQFNWPVYYQYPFIATGPVFDNEFLFEGNTDYMLKSVDYSQHTSSYGTLNADGSCWESEYNGPNNYFTQIEQETYATQLVHGAQNTSWTGTIADIKDLHYSPATGRYPESELLSQLVQFQLVYGAATTFTNAAIDHYLEVAANRGKVKLYHMRRGMNTAPPGSSRWARVEAYSALGYATHADDFYYLFALNICIDGRACIIPDASVADMEASLWVIDHIFRGYSQTANELDGAITAVIYNNDGSVDVDNNFYENEMKLFNKIIPEIVKEAESVVSSALSILPSALLLMCLFLELL